MVEDHQESPKFYVHQSMSSDTLQILNWHMRNIIKECNVITLRNKYSNTTLPQLFFLQLLNNLSLSFSFF